MGFGLTRTLKTGAPLKTKLHGGPKPITNTRFSGQVTKHPAKVKGLRVEPIIRGSS